MTSITLDPLMQEFAFEFAEVGLLDIEFPDSAPLPVELYAIQRGMRGPEGAPAATYITFPAAVPLGGNRAVRLLSGRLIYASSDSAGDANLFLGLTMGAVSADATAQVQTTGVMTEPSWSWIADTPVFCGAAGVLTQTPPSTGFSLIVGIATSPTQIYIGPKAPVVF